MKEVDKSACIEKMEVRENWLKIFLVVPYDQTIRVIGNKVIIIRSLCLLLKKKCGDVFCDTFVPELFSRCKLRIYSSQV